MRAKETLLEVKNDGEKLVLLDGRQSLVNPGDMQTVSIWIPTAELEITEGASEGGFAVRIRNLEQNEEISARWI